MPNIIGNFFRYFSPSMLQRSSNLNFNRSVKLFCNYMYSTITVSWKFSFVVNFHIGKHYQHILDYAVLGCQVWH